MSERSSGNRRGREEEEKVVEDDDENMALRKTIRLKAIWIGCFLGVMQSCITVDHTHANMHKRIRDDVNKPL